MNTRPPLFALIFAASLSSLSACAPGSWGAFPTSTGPESQLLCGSEVGELRFNNLFEAINVLRPHFLRGRAGSNGPVAYVDGARMGDLDFLRSMSPRGIDQIRYLSAADATTRYGTGHDGGALLVATNPGHTLACGR